MDKPDCEVVQHSDRMQCTVCGLAYDAGESYPPRCPFEPVYAGEEADGFPAVAVFFVLLTLALTGSAIIRYFMGL